MFTNRFMKLFIALGLAAIIALTVRGVVVTASNASAAKARVGQSAKPDPNVLTGQAKAENWAEKYGKPAQPDSNVLTGQAAAEAWAEKYGKPAQPARPDLNVLTGQAKAEAWAEKYGKPAQPDLNVLTGQAGADARLTKASRLEELAKIKDGGTAGH